MKISTQGRYGLRALVDLAEHEEKNAIPLREISRRQDISERYLEQLFAKLRKAGIIESVRGAYGGYKLKKEPEEITVGDVLRILEGYIVPVYCTGKAPESCKMQGDCVTHEVWEELRKKVVEVVDSITLADLKKKAVKLHNQHNEGNMYYI